MNIDKMREYIDETIENISQARNHGMQGNNWWYPTPYTVAYNVKIYEFLDIDAVRKRMSKLQNDYYSDDGLFELGYYEMLNTECGRLREDIQDISKDIQDVCFAGRSGGWCEVTYRSIDESDTEDLTYDEVKELYDTARDLQETEIKVRNFIEKRKKDLCKYMASDAYIIDTVEKLMTDDEIKDIYTSKAQSLLNKCR